MATMYCSPTGNNATPISPASPGSIAQCVAYGNANAGPHTIYMIQAEEDYVGYYNLTNANWANGIIQGVTDFSTPSRPLLGAIQVAAVAGQNGFYTNKANITVNDVSFRDSDSTHYNATVEGAGCVFNRSVIRDAGVSGIYAKNVKVTLNHCKIENARIDGTGSCLYANSAGRFECNDCIITESINHKFSSISAAIVSLNTTFGNNSTFNNCIIGGHKGAAIANNSTGGVEINNSIILPPLYPDAYNLVNSPTGTFVVNNSYIGMGWPTHRTTLGTITLNNCVTNQARNFIRYKRQGIVQLTFDDYPTGIVRDFEPLLAARGLTASFYITARALEDVPSNVDVVKGLISRGTVEVGLHGYSHSDQTLTGNAFSITKAGHTVNIDRSNDQIVILGASPVTVTGFKGKRLRTIRTELTAGGCTCGALTTNLENATLGESLADSSGAQASPYTTQLLIDPTGATGYLYVEIVMGKERLSELLDEEVTTFAPPFGLANATTKAIAAAAGFIGQRNAISTSNYWLSAIDIFDIRTLPYTSFIDADEQNICNWVHSIAQSCAQGGGIVSLLIHAAVDGDGFTIEATASQYALVLDTLLQYPELYIGSQTQTINYIKTSGYWTDDGTGADATAGDSIWSRTWTDLSDYRLRAGSPCINAGDNSVWTGTPNVTDFSGRKITDAAGNIIAPGGIVDIGAYEYTGNDPHQIFQNVFRNIFKDIFNTGGRHDR